MPSRELADSPNLRLAPSTPARPSPLRIRRESIVSSPATPFSSHTKFTPGSSSSSTVASPYSTGVTPLAGGSTKITTQLVRSQFSRSSTSPAAIASPATSRNLAGPSPTAVPARTPLAPRDRNAFAVPRRQLSTPSLSARWDNATPSKMAPVANTTATSVRQPQMPVLSPAVAKGLNRGAGQPLTPKVAVGRQQPYQTAAVISPATRRIQVRSETPTSALSSTRTGAERDEVASPVPPYLSANNVTPRSGKRQSRVDSANSTPNGTPVPDRNGTWEIRSGLGIAGSDIDGYGGKARSVTFSPPEVTKPDPDSKFFYAADAKATSPTLAQAAKPPLQSKPSSFFYASESAPQTANPPVASPLNYTSIGGGSQDNFASKFIYANGSPDISSVGSFPSSRPGSVISTAPRLAANKSTPPTRPSGLQRPPSPIKSLSQGSTKGASTSGSAQAAAPPLQASTAALRRTSLESNGRRADAHSRAGSLVATDGPAGARLMSQQVEDQPTSPSSGALSPAVPSFPFPATAPAAAGLSSILQMSEDLIAQTPLTEEPGQVDSLASPQSPTKSQADSQLNDLIVTARRERKVQDLEITNASLEAINRTLERQLRKQTAELRRFRRMSRHGRLSLAPSLPNEEDGAAGNGRIVSGSSAGGGALARAGMTLEDLSEDDEDFSGDERSGSEDESSATESDSASGSGGLSPHGAALRGERRRRRDERRLRLDLTKHQELLIDSQRMNQSIKRCLGWTEELIKEGTKALNFTVRVSEVELGGRVLHPEEHGGDLSHGAEDESEELGGYVFEGGGGEEDGPESHASSGGKHDRDSAVELHGGDGD